VNGGTCFQIEVVTPVPAAAAALADLHAICFASSLQEPWSDVAIATLLSAPGTVGAVATNPAGDAVGFVIGRTIADEGEVLTLCVAPAQRRYGVASALMLKLQELLAPVGGVLLEVAVTNRAACELYQSLGFREVGRRQGYYRRDGRSVDALILKSG